MIFSMNEIFSSMDKTYHPLMTSLFVMFWGGNWKKSILPRANCIKTLTQRHDKLKFHPWIKRFYPWIKLLSVKIIPGWKDFIHGWENLIPTLDVFFIRHLPKASNKTDEISSNWLTNFFPQMTLLSMDKVFPSMDKIFPSMFDFDR